MYNTGDSVLSNWACNIGYTLYSRSSHQGYCSSYGDKEALDYVMIDDKHIAKFAKNYVSIKKDVTKCMQRNFKQVCHRCKFYAKCSLYTKYFDAWTKLERATR